MFGTLSGFAGLGNAPTDDARRRGIVGSDRGEHLATPRTCGCRNGPEYLRHNNMRESRCSRSNERVTAVGTVLLAADR
jgi:hypothetical protein